MTEDPSLTINGAVKQIGPQVGVVPDTLRSWVKQSHVDTGRLPGTTSTDAAKIKKLEVELREVKRANEILLAASSFFVRELDPRLPWYSGSSPNIASRSGSSRFCRVLTQHGCKVALSTYYAA